MQAFVRLIGAILKCANNHAYCNLQFIMLTMQHKWLTNCELSKIVIMQFNIILF